MSLWILFACVFLVTFNAPTEASGASAEINIFGLSIHWGDLVSCASFCLALAGLLCFHRFTVQIKGAGGVSYSLESVEDLGHEQIAFLATYVIPFATFEINSIRKTLAWGVLLAVTGMMYISMDRCYANPTLSLMGFKMYKAVYLSDSGQAREVVLVSRQRLRVGCDVRMLPFADGACFARLSGSA